MKEILILFFGLLMVFLAIILPDIIGNYIDGKRFKLKTDSGKVLSAIFTFTLNMSI